MSKPKPIKLGESRAFEVDGMTVVLKRVEPTRYTWKFNGGEEQGNAEQKSRYEIHVNEKHFGWINCPSGFGSGWEIVAFGRADRGTMPDAHVLEAPWKIQHGLMQTDRDILLLLVPRLIREGKLVTREAMDKIIAAKKVAASLRAAQAKIEAAEREERRAKAAAEQREQRKVERAALVERIEGLELVMQRDLSNLERAAVVASLEIFRRELVSHDAHSRAFHDAGLVGR
jgi:hypothetical protein